MSARGQRFDRRLVSSRSTRTTTSATTRTLCATCRPPRTPSFSRNLSTRRRRTSAIRPEVPFDVCCRVDGGLAKGMPGRTCPTPLLQSSMVQSVVTATEGTQVLIGVVATILAMNDVMHVEVTRCSTPRHAASVPVACANALALLLRDRRMRASVRIVDVTHDGRIARQRRELGVVELHAVREPAAIRSDPHSAGGRSPDA
jgi:hypothetical protein